MNNMTNEQCARCDRNLSSNNTNPDRLCGYCQRTLSSSTKKLREWRKTKVRITGMENGGLAGLAYKRANHKRAGHKLPGLDTLPVPYLLACCRELKRRAKDARMVLAAVGEEIK